MAAKLWECGAFESERFVEATATAVVRRYVELGQGLGIVFGRLKSPSRSCLHERSMVRYFTHPRISFIWRKGAVISPFGRAFADTVKEMLRS